MILGVNICDFEKCQKGSSSQRKAVQIDTLRAQNDPTYSMEIDDSFFRFINVRGNYEMPVPGQRESAPKERQFCSAGCLRDFYNESNYSAPLSPREQAVIAENNRKVEESRKATVDGFGKPAEEPKTAKILSFPKPTVPATVEPEVTHEP